MKRFTLLAALGLCSISLFAQDAQKEEPKEEGFVFTTVKELPITSVKNQSRAGTCWCYSSMAFLESELLRMGKGEYDFSEMYIVHQTYLDRADAAVRTHGDVSFSQGGSFYDVIYGMKKFGLVPEEVMRPGVSEEGLGVDNVYYDNIIHICVYEGRKSLYAKDITKQMFKGVVPDDFLQWAILSDMDFMGVDSKGYHYQATVCVPDGASCYMVNITAGKDGGLAFELVR